jgi:hypothetical protein
VTRHQKCSGCQTQKPLTDFHKDRSRKSGRQRYCKECKRFLDKHGYHPKYKQDYIIYYLPKEKYVGMTFNLKRRITAHEKQHKRDVTGYRVLMTTKNGKIAHIIETFLHLIGFNGFRY